MRWQCLRDLDHFKAYKKREDGNDALGENLSDIDAVFQQLNPSLTLNACKERMAEIQKRFLKKNARTLESGRDLKRDPGSRQRLAADELEILNVYSSGAE
jgi:hypothetical protein